MKCYRCLITALSVFVLSLSVHASLLTENFNEGVGNSYSSPSDVTLPSGVWTFYGMRSNTSSGVTAINFNSNGGYIISPAVAMPGKVSFKYRSGGSNKDVITSYTSDGGVTWIRIDSLRIASSSSAYNTKVVSLPEEAHELESVRIRILSKSSNVYIDDFVIEAAQPENPEPVYNDPTLISSVQRMNFMNVAPGNTRDRSFSLSGVLLDGESVSLSLTGDAFTMSADGVDFGTSISLPVVNNTLSDTAIIVRFAPVALQSYSATLTVTCGSAQKTISISGVGAETSSNEYYISPSGNDQTGDGSFENPWYNIQYAVNQAVAGDVIICRGGTYSPNMRDSSGKTTVRIRKSGTAEQPYTIRAYDGETPVFDFAATQLLADKSMVGVRGFEITGDWWHIYGLTITHAGDNGIKLEGSHNIIERCVFCYNLDSGLQLGFGHVFSESGFGSSNDGTHCSYNTVIDCDSYRNCDFDSNYGSDADGFACKMHNGIGNRFIRCRAWENSDDAWDLYETDFSVVLVECWAWGSGRPENHLWVKDYLSGSASFSGNGNGIKMGGNGTGGSSKGKHEAWNCVAFNCDKTGSVKGFDQNSHGGGEKLVGCLAFGCGYDFMYERASANSEYYNNVCIGRQEIAGGTDSNNALGSPTDKGWQNNVVYGVSMDDYIDLSEETAKGPRGVDGSMPANFARLKAGRPQINAGLDLAVPYTDEFSFLLQPIYGSARDLGPYEYTSNSSSTPLQQIFTYENSDKLLLLNTNGSQELTAKVSTAKIGNVVLEIYNMQGQQMLMRELGVLSADRDYYYPVNVSMLPAGVYVCRVHTPTGVMSAKFAR